MEIPMVVSISWEKVMLSMIIETIQGDSIGSNLGVSVWNDYDEKAW